MTIPVDMKAYEADCAFKLLNDHRAQFYGWTGDQVDNAYEQEGDWAAQKAFRMAYAIVREQEKLADASLSESASAIKKTQIQGSSKPQQAILQLTAALPTPPTQTQKQKLQSSTMFTPQSIVSPLFDKTYRGTNWPHFENVLKLYALGLLIKGEMTPQQKKDKEELEAAITQVGRKKFKNNNLSAQQIMKKTKGVYIEKGKEIIANLFKTLDKADQLSLSTQDRQTEIQYTLDPYAREIKETQNEYNARQLSNVLSRARSIAIKMHGRYKTR